MADFTGDSGDNSITGGDASEVFDYSQGGQDTVNAAGGNDSVWGGAGIDALDRFDGGDGADSLEFNGDYSAGVTLQADTIKNFEYLYIYASGSAVIRLAEGNIGAGQQMQINAVTSNIVLDASAITTGSLRFQMFANGQQLHGTANNDSFNVTGAFSLGRDNIYDGGAGEDTVSFSGAVDLKAAGHSFASIEHMSTSAHLNLTLADANIAAGATLFFTEGAADGTIIFVDAHRDKDGHLSAIGGATGDSFVGGGLGDTLSGGDGEDTLRGGHGGDSLSGGLGGDIFVFRTVLDSVHGGADLITDLDDSDIIDLAAIDADTVSGGVQHFSLVEAFGGHAGELTLVFDARRGVTHLMGDVDGDGRADLTIDITGDHSDFSGFLLDIGA